MALPYRPNDNHAIKIFIVFVSYCSGIALTFLFTVLLSHLTDAQGAGLYFITITVIEICATLARLGLDNVILKRSAIAYSAQNTRELATLFWKSLFIVCISSTIIFFPASFLLKHSSLLQISTDTLKETLPIMLFSIVSVSLLTIMASFYKGVGESSKATLFQYVLPAALMVSGGLIFLFHSTTSFTDITSLYLASYSLSLFISIVFWLFRFPCRKFRWAAIESRELLHKGLPLLLISCMSLIMGWTDILLLGALTTASDTGVYAIATKIASCIPLVLIAVNTVVAPRFAVLHTQSDQAGLEQLVQQSSKWMLIITLPLSIIIFTFAEFILVIYGGDFEDGANLLKILTVGQTINVTTGSVGYLLLMTGYEKIMRNIILLCALLNLAGNLLFIPHYGVTAAAFSTSFSLSLMNILAFCFVWKKLGINTLGYFSRFLPRFERI